MTKQTKKNILQTIVIFVGFIVVALVGSWAFGQDGPIKTISWVIFITALVASALLATGLGGSIASLFRKDKRDEV